MFFGLDPSYGEDKAMIAVFDSNTQLVEFVDPKSFGARTTEEIEGVIELLELIQP